MEKQLLNINGETISIPACYQRVDSMPGDPANSVPFEVQTENAICVAFISAVDYSKSLPRTQNELVNGIRHFLADNQGLIEVVAEKEYVFSIVKNLKQPGGVQYILTYQKFCKEFIVNIQAFFEEIGITGTRECMVHEICRREGVLKSDDPFAGWTKDPYDDSVTTGALMNLSEQERFDAKFPGHPLTMCREFVHCLTGKE